MIQLEINQILPRVVVIQRDQIKLYQFQNNIKDHQLYLSRIKSNRQKPKDANKTDQKMPQVCTNKQELHHHNNISGLKKWQISNKKYSSPFSEIKINFKI